MQPQKNNGGHITFSNKPKLSEHDIQKDFNERRIGLVPQIEYFLSNHDFFKTKQVNVTFKDKGVGSLVCILETTEEKLVLKIPLSKTFSEGEGLFLKVWEKVGVKVPNIIEEGKITEYSYILMEFINAPLLSEKYSSDEMIEKGIDLEVGKVLNMMHQPHAEGYGHVINGKAQYVTFQEWLNDKKLKEAISYVQENKLLGSEHGSLSIALKLLTEHANNNQSSYCHFDYGSSNIFATDPITVFDPNPQFNNGYLDLGLSVFNCISAGVSPKQLITGYFGNKPFNEKVLHASVLLNSYIKLPSRHMKGKSEHIKNIQDYLSKNTHFLI